MIKPAAILFLNLLLAMNRKVMRKGDGVETLDEHAIRGGRI
jgi:hypothetical protein